MVERDWDERSKDKLFVAHYEELRAIARACLSRERPGLTLRPTELTNEAYLAFKQRNLVPGASRAEVLGAFSILLKRVIADYHRKRSRQKRGGNLRRITFRTDVGIDDSASTIIDSLALDEALDELERVHGIRKRDGVLLKFFGGLTFVEIGQELGMGTTSAKDDWRFSRAFLGWRLGDNPNSSLRD